MMIRGLRSYEHDPDCMESFDFHLARWLGKSLVEIQALPSAEYEQWAAFARVERHFAEFHAQVEADRARAGLT